MIILTAANKKYEELALSLGRSLTYHGHNLVTYNVDDLGWGTPFTVPPPIDSRQIRRYKPRYMLEEYVRLDGVQFAWLDADMVMRRPIADLDLSDCDIAMPIKKAKDGTFKFKSSAVFVNPTKGAYRLLEAWRDEIPSNGRGDQRYFKSYVAQHAPLSWEFAKKRDCIDTPAGRIKLLSEEYNYEIREDEQLDKIPHWARIVQFSGMGGPKKFKDKIRLMNRYWR